MYTVGDESCYNGKHSAKYFSFQVWIGMDGRPLGFTGPHAGSTHDSECIANKPLPFDHKQDEFILADKAYVSVMHCLTQEKGLSTESKDSQHLFDVEFRRVRTRVERFFALFRRHRIMVDNQHTSEVAGNAFALLFYAEAYKFKQDQPEWYRANLVIRPFEDPNVQKWVTSRNCHCLMHKTTPHDEERLTLCKFREERIVHIESEPNVILGTSKSPKNSVGGQKTYATSTSNERSAVMSAKTATKRAQRSAVIVQREHINTENRKRYKEDNVN
eukprot:PhM_4_TR16774/c2_g3_i19/m.22681